MWNSDSGSLTLFSPYFQPLPCSVSSCSKKIFTQMMWDVLVKGVECDTAGDQLSLGSEEIQRSNNKEIQGQKADLGSSPGFQHGPRSFSGQQSWATQKELRPGYWGAKLFFHSYWWSNVFLVCTLLSWFLVSTLIPWERMPWSIWIYELVWLLL